MDGKLHLALLIGVQEAFKETHRRSGTEDRLLIYRNEFGEIKVYQPDSEATVVEVKCDLPLSFEADGHMWDLAFDLHSHHEMGAFWSRKDDRNERIRGVIFGVFSWKGGTDSWRWRRFDGNVFIPLLHNEVIDGGQ